MPRLPGFDTDCTISFDGEVVPARRGEPVAGALLAAGRVVLSRSAKYHRPRGAFCLAASCAGCLVRIDGLPSQRACRTPCREGLSVESQNAIPDARHDLLGSIDRLTPRGLDHHHLATFSVSANRAAVAISRRLAGVARLPDPEALGAFEARPIAEERVDALVVGAGPAGLAAAEALAEAGRRVLLADDAAAAGGRLRARLEPAGAPDLAWAGRVLAHVAAAGGEAAIGSAVVGLWSDDGAAIALVESDGPPRRLRLVRAGRVVLCPGGHPQPLEIPGADRPGVLSGRGVAAALAEHGVVPGERAAVVGEGREAIALADRLAAAGMAVERIAAPRGRILGRARVAALALPGGLVRCDTLALAGPPAPATELARSLGALVAFDTVLGAFAVRAGSDGSTGIPGVLAAGETTGFLDAAGAAEAGRRTGEAARG